jgi:hypothetical protein
MKRQYDFLIGLSQNAAKKYCEVNGFKTIIFNNGKYACGSDDLKLDRITILLKEEKVTSYIIG